MSVVLASLYIDIIWSTDLFPFQLLNRAQYSRFFYRAKQQKSEIMFDDGFIHHAEYTFEVPPTYLQPYFTNVKLAGSLMMSYTHHKCDHTTYNRAAK